MNRAVIVPLAALGFLLFQAKPAGAAPPKHPARNLPWHSSPQRPIQTRHWPPCRMSSIDRVSASN